MFYKNVSRFRKEHKNAAKQLNRERLIAWRRELSVTKIERPTKLDRARRLGYKPKQGIILARVRINRGGRRLIPPNRGRRSVRTGITRITPNQSRQVIAENRAARRYPNLEILNSYRVAQDGKSIYYEVIMLDPDHPVIQADKNLNWIVNQKGRSFRGLTSAARKSRGLRHKGIGSERFR